MFKSTLMHNCDFEVHDEHVDEEYLMFLTTVLQGKMARDTSFFVERTTHLEDHEDL